MAIGDNIRTARINKGLTQTQLAELLQYRNCIVGNTTISNWENGTSKPDPDTIEELCKILGVDANYLLDFNKIKKESQNDDISKREVLFNKTKEIISNDDWETIEFIMNKTIKNYEESKKKGSDN